MSQSADAARAPSGAARPSMPRPVVGLCARSSSYLQSAGSSRRHRTPSGASTLRSEHKVNCTADQSAAPKRYAAPCDVHRWPERRQAAAAMLAEVPVNERDHPASAQALLGESCTPFDWEGRAVSNQTATGDDRLWIGRKWRSRNRCLLRRTSSTASSRIAARHSERANAGAIANSSQFLGIADFTSGLLHIAKYFASRSAN